VSRISPLIRISFGLVVVTSSIILCLDLLGFVPSPANAQLEARMRLCEILASQTTSAAQNGDYGAIRLALVTAVQRNDEVLSAGLRAADGKLLVTAGNHRELWAPASETGSSTTHARIPIFRNDRSWGTLEVRFAELGAQGVLESLWERPLVRLAILVACVGFLGYLVYLRRTLRHLDPSAVIPARVQSALDVMTESVILLDEDEQIVLANRAFADQVGASPASLLGARASSFPWRPAAAPGRRAEAPWLETLRESHSVKGVRVLLGDDDARAFAVNSAPVFDGSGRAKGAIVTFDDVTELERTSAQLEETVQRLEKSQDEVRLQNEELRLLARTDPLTGVANRRYFFTSFEEAFEESRRTGRAFSCVMADIDHFKQVNDLHGHTMGDEVIRLVSASIRSVIRSSDAVCRYGGEEFCVALLDTPLEAARAVAERMRQTIDSPGFARIPLTVSFGVSGVEFGAQTLAELIQQADAALYAAKRAGRNRVLAWSEAEEGGA